MTMIARNRLTFKIPAMVVGSALVVAIVSGVASYLASSSNVREMAVDKLHAMSTSRATQLQAYMQSIEDDLMTQASSPMVSEALDEFVSAWSNIGSSHVDILQKAYITNNPHPTGKKDELDSAGSSSYDITHEKYHPWFRTFLRARGYYDIFLFDLDGNLVYTVFKELDYATNLNTGEWKDTDLGNAFRAAKSGDGTAIHFFDFKPYAPSHDAPASFVSTPILKDGKKQGVLVFQMPIDQINEVMSGKEGLGETGETIIIGKDGFLRNDSTLTPEVNDILTSKVTADVTQEAFASGYAEGEISGYRDMRLFATVTSIRLHETEWAVATVQSLKEINLPVAALRNKLILVCFLVISIVGAIGVFGARNITRQISALVQSMRKLADGDLNADIPSTDKGDEISEMARAVAVFKDNAIERERLEQAAQSERDMEMRRQAHVEKIVADFREKMDETLKTVTSHTNDMQSSAAKLNRVAENASTEAQSANNSSAGAFASVNSVAATAEQLSQSIQEIAVQTSKTKSLMEETFSTAENANTDIKQLSDAAEQIGTIVNLISDIAEQTNLLALNATIEAARAGDAGKGFAVVASEVKELAVQTAKATEDISQQITGVQSSIQGTVDAIESITSKIEMVSELTTSVASGIEEQEAATQEIATSVRSASTDTESVAQNVEAVTEAINQTNTESETVNSASALTASAANDLAKAVEAFLGAVTVDLDNRRQSMRKKLHEVVILNDKDQRRKATIVDLSEHGAKIDCELEVSVGETLSITFNNGHIVPATVVRVDDKYCAVKFQSPLGEALKSSAA